jgi:hypothetical protein
VGVRIAELTIAAEYVELVALRVGERHPTAAVGAAVIGDFGGALSEQSRDLGFARPVGRSKIEVQPILDLFAFRYLDEEQSRTAVGREDHALLVARLVGILGILAHGENLGPPHRLLVGIPRVDRGVADPRRHEPTMSDERAAEFSTDFTLGGYGEAAECAGV